VICFDGSRRGSVQASRLSSAEPVPSQTRSDTYWTFDRPWVRPRGHPWLSAGEVHVWRADLDGTDDGLLALLSAPERERASRFSRAPDGRRWARAHGLLRYLLASYLNADPCALSFTTGSHGKPELTSGGLEFNLSHSQAVALYAFAPKVAVGVDVEVARWRRDEVAIARRGIGAAPAGRLEKLEQAGRSGEFLRLWVRHEAEVKCLGSALGDAGARIGKRPWIAELDMGLDARGAVAVEREPRDLGLWAWQI
jgi:hypothetical protein